MSKIEDRLHADRATRNAARGVVDAGLSQVKTDLAARGVGGRIVDKASGEVRGVADQALAVARESKGIIAGTVAALGLWLLRKPILRAAKGLIADRQSPVHDESDIGDASDWSTDSD